MTFEKTEVDLSMHLIPVKGNEELLKELPHRELEDLAVVYRLDDTLITHDMLRTNGVTFDQLQEDALSNAKLWRPETLRNLNDVLREMMGPFGSVIPDEPSPMWVATVEGGLNGAAVICYPGFLDQAAETLGGDFYALPSSIHEMLLLPDDGSMELGELEEMVRSVNETEVAPEERLSDTVYHYDSQERIFENARTFEAREAEKLYAPEGPSITALLIEPNRSPQVIRTEDSLSRLQELVGGNIEVVCPFEDNVGLICNEEGKLYGLPLNRALRDDRDEIYDVIAGPFLVVGLSPEGFQSPDSHQLEKYEKVFHQPEGFLKLGKGIMAFPVPDETVVRAADRTEKAAGRSGEKPHSHKLPDHDAR